MPGSCVRSARAGLSSFRPGNSCRHEPLGRQVPALLAGAAGLPPGAGGRAAQPGEAPAGRGEGPPRRGPAAAVGDNAAVRAEGAGRAKAVPVRRPLSQASLDGVESPARCGVELAGEQQSPGDRRVCRLRGPPARVAGDSGPEGRERKWDSVFGMGMGCQVSKFQRWGGSLRKVWSREVTSSGGFF